MRLESFNEVFEVDDPETLTSHLNARRRGVYGAFHLTGQDPHPYVALHTNGEVAYLHVFLRDGHAGYQPRGMTPPDCPATVRFLNLDGSPAGSIEMPASCLVSVDVAIRAACDFLEAPGLPPSIEWLEL